MSHPIPTPPPRPPKLARLPPALIGAGVLVVAVGFGLPQFVSSGEPSAAAHVPAAAVSTPTPPRPTEPAVPVAPSAGDVGYSLLKLVVGLAVVCGLCAFVARWAAPAQPVAPGAVEVLASIPVGRGVLHLVRAGDRRLLIGTDPSGVKALVELFGPEPEADAVPSAEPVHTAAPASAEVPPRPAPPAAPPTRDEILNLLFRLRGGAGAPPPG
jgi:flagellar biogenesis protein FliO